MAERSFQEDLMRAMLLARNFRLHAVTQRINPKATRVAIKVMAEIDDYFARKKLSSKEDFQLEIMASKLARKLIEEEEKKGN